MSVSFGFKKKIESKVVGADQPRNEEKDYLNSVEGKVIQSTVQKEQPKELVIPLIRKNRYKLPPSAGNRTENKKDTPQDLLEAKAAQELIEESRSFLENVEHNGDENFDNLKIPLLLKNKVPDGFETDERLDVSLRPNEATEAQYDQVPVAAFGLAVLRGMGWTPEEGIGKTFKQNTKMLEQKIRPKGLGLGADVPAALKSNSKKASSTTTKSTGSDNEDSLSLRKGANVLVQSGALRNKYGTVLGIDIETARCVIKMAIGGKTEQVGQHCLRVVSKKEYDRNAKDLSRLSKAYSGETIEIIGNGKRSGKRDIERIEDEIDNKNDSKLHARDDDRALKTEPGGKRRKKHREHSPEVVDLQAKQKKHKKHKVHGRSPLPSQNSNKISWVLPLMRVRIIDKAYRKGRYYREKVIVEDVLGKGMCCCKTDDGKILDDIKDSMLETVIPKSSSDSYVIIVHSRKSKNNGKLAKILQKDREKSEALLQLIDDRDVVVKVSFEDMCEFTGNPEHNAMF